MRPLRSAVVLVVIVLLAGAGAAAVGSSAATADTQTTRSHHYVQGYSSKKMVRFYRPNMCVRAWAQGALNFDAHRTAWKRDTTGGGETVYAYSIDHVKLRYNSLTIDTYKPNGSKCTSTPKNYVRMRTVFKARAFRCSWNPSFTASVPFGASVSFWPDCGDKKLARWVETDVDGGHHFVMSNSSAAVAFKGMQDQGKWFQKPQSDLTWGCYAVAATLTPKTSTEVDTKHTPRMRVCPTWNGSLAGW